MAYEQASLEQQESRGNLVLVFEQRPLVVGWFELGFAAMLLSFLSVFFTGNVLGLAVFVGFFPLMFGAALVRQLARPPGRRCRHLVCPGSAFGQRGPRRRGQNGPCRACCPPQGSPHARSGLLSHHCS